MKYIGHNVIQAKLLDGKSVKEILDIHKRAVDGKDYRERYLVLHDDGYQSLIEKDVFENTHHPLDAMTFGDALVMLKNGHRVCRREWNVKGMWLKMITSGNGNIGQMPSDYTLMPWVGMKTADNGFVPWLCSQTDMLAEDWMLLEG